MEKDRLKSIVQNLKLVIETLESEIYSDVQAYTDTRENYDDPIEYLNNDDDDGYPDWLLQHPWQGAFLLLK